MYKGLIIQPFIFIMIEDQQITIEEKRLKKIYEIAVKTRNFEITQLVQRNNFFMIFQGVLIACIINSNNTVPVIHTIICFVGIIISFYQMQAASGAKFWQEYWETEVNKAERSLKKIYESDAKFFHQLFDKKIDDVQKTIFERLYANKLNKYCIFEPLKYKEGFSRWLKTYNPFTSIEERILTKPSVSKVPIQTARLLLCIWLLTLFATTKWGAYSYEYLKNIGIINGLPGKSITNIDIRNQTIPNRKDGFDDSDEIKKINIQDK
ncbi:hypothetical protein BVD86_18910 [Acinetobacter pittii]|nr:hypothetical protein BVD86_18910 [Acinetobacter pittii]